uniref:Brix domain-containing protein n=1 Tax=Noctiluca scintillans TaxID=2966 RepID=A0A7S1FDJ4_NOCSC|mmetsp:Transcript_52502/g.139796  ORF Transcript_52502/g.139796 Transcript_52502/m.139796 type:complete len:308 (+) Transcript_52502:74-997(+)
MIRRNARLRKEYLYQKALEDKEAVTFDKKRKLQDALDKNKPIPTELKSESKKLRTVLDLADERTEKQHKSIDDEYAYLGVKDPRVLITTSRDPSARLGQFVKELRILFPGAQRVNRGSFVVKDLMELARSHEMTDAIIIHEHRGEPDGLIVSHLPFGPTAYFGLSNVVLRHDLSKKPPPMSEANPHLIFHGFTAKVGKRVQTILKALFPPAKVLGDRVMTFGNCHDIIHFRHHTFKRPAGPGGEGHKPKAQDVELAECGPRFTLRLYRIELGTIDMKDVQVEWVLRPYFNKQREALAEPEEEEVKAN